MLAKKSIIVLSLVGIKGKLNGIYNGRVKKPLLASEGRVMVKSPFAPLIISWHDSD